MKVDEPLLRHAAKVARVGISDEEIREFLPQLNEVFSYFEMLKSVEAELPAEEVSEQGFRDDAVTTPGADETARIRAQFPRQKDGIVSVPRSL